MGKARWNSKYEIAGEKCMLSVKAKCEKEGESTKRITNCATKVKIRWQSSHLEVPHRRMRHSCILHTCRLSGPAVEW